MYLNILIYFKDIKIVIIYYIQYIFIFKQVKTYINIIICNI